MLLAFAPFIAFAAIDRLVGPVEGMFAGFAVSAALLIRDWSQGRGAKVLEIGTAALFGALGCYALFADPAWSLMGVRLVVDTGLLLIVLVSIAIRQPFTLQYARERVPEPIWALPVFFTTNRRITVVWAMAFAVHVAADAAAEYVPAVPLWLDIVASIAAFLGAVWFTRWYPAAVQRRFANAAAS